MHRGRLRGLGAALLAMATLLLVAPAQAHDYLVGSTPEQGATLDAAPSQVSLEFNTAIGEKFAQVAVVGPDGTAYSSRDPVVDGAVVTQAVEGIPAGTDVTISYRVVSSDGHPIGGTVGFAVAASASAQEPEASPSPSATSPSSSEASPSTDAPTKEAVPTTEDLVDPAATSTDTGGLGPLLPWLALLLLGSATVAGIATFVVSRRRAQAAVSGSPSSDETP
jgi:methionine-rich copper-binding protein CopC